MASPTDKDSINLKDILKDVIVVVNPAEDTYFRDMFRKLPDAKLDMQYVFPNVPVFPGKPIVFNDEECFVGPGDFKLTDLTVRINVSPYVHDWFSKVLDAVKEYNAKAEIREAVRQYCEEHPVTEIGGHILFRCWLAKLTFFAALSGYNAPGIWSSVRYFWGQPDAWVWMWADGLTVDEAIIEDITS